MENKVLVPSEKDIYYAHKVAEWTKEARSMLPKTPEQVLGLFAQGWSVLVINEVNYPLSHAAITFEWPDDWLELGAVVTEKNHRKLGYGHMVVLALLATVRNNYPEKRIFALCNESSLPIFRGFGGRLMKYEELPDEVFGECISCPKYIQAKNDGKACCDTPVNMTDIRI